jgi:hypothetical protein
MIVFMQKQNCNELLRFGAPKAVPNWHEKRGANTISGFVAQSVFRNFAVQRPSRYSQLLGSRRFVPL